MLDTIKGIETPEGITIDLHIAGPMVRIAAYLIDLVFRLILFALMWFVSAFNKELSQPIMLIFMFMMEWFYPVIFEVYANGQTPGKRIMNIVTLHDDGTPIAWSASLLRNLLRGADILPFAYVTALVVMACNKEFKRLGDLTAGTIVVYKNTRQRSEIPDAAPIATKCALNLEEQRAILSFAERSVQLSDARRAELADHAADIINDEHKALEEKPASYREQTLLGIANWLLGKH